MLLKTQLKLNHINSFEKNNIKTGLFLFIGDYITLGFKINENEKIRLQEYSGIIIAKKNTKLNLTIIIRCNFQHKNIECCFFLNSPDLLFIKIRYSINLTRSKLYYLRTISKIKKININK